MAGHRRVRRIGHDGDAELVPSVWKDSGLGSSARKPWAPSQGPSKRFGVWDPQENPGHRPKNRPIAIACDCNCFQSSHRQCRTRKKKKIIIIIIIIRSHFDSSVLPIPHLSGLCLSQPIWQRDTWFLGRNVHSSGRTLFVLHVPGVVLG